ncbi:MAG: hypothetical protein RL660_6 [Bacteroidota bacterium]|jgi:hypothetical protein
MTTKERAISSLQNLHDFFEAHQVLGWANSTKRAMYKLQEEDTDIVEVLYNFVGVGMGSLIDLVICKANGHHLVLSEQETERQLMSLAKPVLEILYALQKSRARKNN